jgi:AcrR family transcriptional regulator
VTIADADGLEAVTFRAIASRLGTGVMSLYSYVPDKQTLVYDMVEQVSGEMELPALTGDWRADLHRLARDQRALLHLHPWLIDAISHLQPLGPAVLAVLEFALGALEPTGLAPPACLETFSLINGFIANFARAELANRAAASAAEADPGKALEQAARLRELLATGRYPRFAAVIMTGGAPAAMDLGAQFDPLLDRILDGLIASADSSTSERPLATGQRTRANFSS